MVEGTYNVLTLLQELSLLQVFTLLQVLTLLQVHKQLQLGTSNGKEYLQKISLSLSNSFSFLFYLMNSRTEYEQGAVARLFVTHGL